MEDYIQCLISADKKQMIVGIENKVLYIYLFFTYRILK